MGAHDLSTSQQSDLLPGERHMLCIWPDCAIQSNHPCGGFFVWGSHRFEPSSTTNLSGTNWNGAAGPQGEYQDDTSKSRERFGTTYNTRQPNSCNSSTRYCFNNTTNSGRGAK
jgi:hypothetical protein